MRPTFDEYLISLAHGVAARSTCDRARVGCMLVQGVHIIATGYNGAIAGAPHCDDVGHVMHNGHCIRTVHAEANAVAQAAYYGARTQGATAYVTHMPCLTCAKLLISAGVAEVVCDLDYGNDDSISLFFDAGVIVRKPERTLHE